jgi:hypothetical protein
MASRSYTASSKTTDGKTSRSTGRKAPHFSSSQESETLHVYPSGSQSSKKRKVVDLTYDDEEDEEAAALAQVALAGKKSFPSRGRVDQQISASWNNKFNLMSNSKLNLLY